MINSMKMFPINRAKFLIDGVDGYQIDGITDAHDFNEEYKGKVVYLTGGEVSPSGMLIKVLYGYPVKVKELHHTRTENFSTGREEDYYLLEFEHMKNKTNFYHEEVSEDLNELRIRNKKLDNTSHISGRSYSGVMFITTKEDIENIRYAYTELISLQQDTILSNFNNQIKYLSNSLDNDIVKKDRLNEGLLEYIDNKEGIQNIN